MITQTIDDLLLGVQLRFVRAERMAQSTDHAAFYGRGCKPSARMERLSALGDNIGDELVERMRRDPIWIVLCDLGEDVLVRTIELVAERVGRTGKGVTVQAVMEIEASIRLEFRSRGVPNVDQQGSALKCQKQLHRRTTQRGHALVWPWVLPTELVEESLAYANAELPTRRG